jgi:proteasome lid subunit RPN8/RPN11
MGMRVRISSAIVAQITALAEASPRAEICGLLLGRDDLIERAEPCRNVAAEPARWFEVDPAALIAAHRAARSGGVQLLGHFHSHPSGRAIPSARDADAAAADGMLWLIAGSGALTAWRAVAEGAIEGRFDPVTLDLVASACANAAPASEGPQLKHLAGKASR